MLRLLALPLVLAACTPTPPSGDATPRSDSTPAAGPDAGLSAAEMARLEALGGPVVLLAPGAGWEGELLSAEAGPYGTLSYEVRWTRGDGACLSLNVANDGIGGPDLPMVSTNVRLPQMPGQPRLSTHQASDDPMSTSADLWGAGTVITDFLELDNGGNPVFAWAISHGENGCLALGLAEAAEEIATMHLAGGGAAGTGSAAGTMGAFRPADPNVFAAFESGSPASPVEMSRGFATPYAEEGSRVDVRELSNDGRDAQVLITLTNLMDDSVEGQRILATFRRINGEWAVEALQQQDRCYRDRGSQTWSAERCR